jgi:hypothetical protein
MFVEALRARLKVLDHEMVRLTMLASKAPVGDHFGDHFASCMSATDRFSSIK